MVKIFSLLFLIFLLICLPAQAQSDPRPNDSIEVALTFGDLTAAPFPNLTPAPAWTVGMERDFNVLDVTTGVMNVCTARVFQITDNIVFWLDNREQVFISEEITGSISGTIWVEYTTPSGPISASIYF